MGEGAVQLSREYKGRIHRLGRANPQLGQMRLDVSVERSVDFHHVKTSRHHVQRMLLAVLHPRRVEDSLPVFVGPAGGTDADFWESIHDGQLPRIVCSQISTGPASRDGCRKNQTSPFLPSRHTLESD